MSTGLRALYLNIHVTDITASRNFYEAGLGYRRLDEDASSVTYSAGHILLRLRHAADHGITTHDGRDRSIALTFLVDDLDAMRAALEHRGVRVTRTLTSRAGAMADLYDPDGHWISLYQPSDASLSWPSGQKIRALRTAGDRLGRADTGLDCHDLLYLFLFVEDLESTSTFYKTALGLEPVEVTPCHRGVTSTPNGVVKYDIGGGLLTTHHVGDGDHAAAHKVTTQSTGRTALGFHTTDLSTSVMELRERGVAVSEVTVDPGTGATASFLDPCGHLYFVCEPSSQMLQRPSGPMIERILTAEL